MPNQYGSPVKSEGSLTTSRTEVPHEEASSEPEARQLDAKVHGGGPQCQSRIVP